MTNILITKVFCVFKHVLLKNYIYFYVLLLNISEKLIIRKIVSHLIWKYDEWWVGIIKQYN